MTAPAAPNPTRTARSGFSPGPEAALHHLLAEMQGLAGLIPGLAPMDRRSADPTAEADRIEATFDNMPV